MEKNKKRRKSFRHLIQSDRDRIEALKDEGHLQKEIAKILKVDAGTISREIKGRKKKNGNYEATNAQRKASCKRSNSKYQGMKIEGNQELKIHIIKGLKAMQAPDEIAGKMKKDNLTFSIGANAIYKWLYSNRGQQYCKYLCTKRYKKKKQKKLPKRIMIKDRISLSQRPKEGVHGEGDLFVSPTKTGTKRSGAIICVPDTKLLVATLIKNKKPAVMTQATNKMLTEITIDDLTMDNGIENRGHKNFSVPVFFADPHAPWQKPHVENSIGLLRRWFLPKGTDLKKISEKELQKYLHILNGKYRKSLGYRSAYEVSLERGIIQKVPTLG